MHRIQGNPYLTALVAIGVIAGVIALILAGVWNNEARGFSPNLSTLTALSVWGGLLGQISVFTLIGSIIVAALAWRPEKASSTTSTPSRTADAADRREPRLDEPENDADR